MRPAVPHHYVSIPKQFSILSLPWKKFYKLINTMMTQRLVPVVRIRILALIIVSFILILVTAKPDGPASYKRGQELFEQQKYDDAALELWNAVLFHTETEEHRRNYDVQVAFTKFMECYIKQNKMVDGLAFVSLESYRRGQTEMGKSYLHQALAVDPNHPLALSIQRDYEPEILVKASKAKISDEESSDTIDSQKNSDVKGKTPEQLYEMASGQFVNKNYEDCADLFEMSCILSGYKLYPSCANAVYCRTMIVDYGYNGTQFVKDMERIQHIIKSETKLYRTTTTTDGTDGDEGSEEKEIYQWRRSSSVHPHMMLGYPMTDPLLKRYVAESVAAMEEVTTRAQAMSGSNHGNVVIAPLPSDLPYSISEYRRKFVSEHQDSDNSNGKIRVGFVGSGFNSKAVLFLSQDMFRFFDSSKFEIHIFSFGPPDHPMFIQTGMRNVDWRERVKSNVEYFHDLLAMNISKDHIASARYIHDQNIHILIEWDGYARQGERAQGLFALRPAPIQILHQEYLGTSGATYVDYIYTDEITSPPNSVHLYTEKLIWMPNHFFSKGHALQKEVKKPTYDYTPKSTPYKLGTGSPSENRCLSSPNLGPKNVTFVYCNFNKLLKANPVTIRSWIRILRNVPDSILCLLENPNIAMPYIRKFIHEAAGSSSTNNHSDPTTFIAGDGDALNERIHFLSWEKNPFDHQMRSQDFCNVMVDSHPYNGHTVAQDTLYGGVPIVTRSDGIDMSSRVTTSANIVLGLESLNSYDGPQQYEDIAIKLGTNQSLYQEIRKKLIDTCLQRNPMHPYWDVARYVKNFETGLTKAWDLFLDGKAPEHIKIEESEIASLGTYDNEISANPSEGKALRIKMK